MSTLEPYKPGTIVQMAHNIYFDLSHPGTIRPGVVKLDDGKWQAAKVEMILVRGYVRGAKNVTILDGRIFPTRKAAITKARELFNG